MKIFITYIVVLSVLFVGYPVSAGSLENSASTATETTVPADIETAISSIQGIDANHALLGTEKIVNNARAAVVYEANSGTLMYAWNPDTQMYPASLVKIMTALLAIENAQLTELVTVSQEAISSVPVDAVSAKLLPGEKLSMQDLVYCILLVSASDACVAVAEHISGSEKAFVELMNRRAAEMGCTATNFTNAHGLHDDNQLTTARDSARILATAMRNETFRTIFSANDYLVEKTNLSENRRIASGNYMKDTSSKLYYDARVIGGRTGVTQDGRRCLATASERNGMQLITVVMGAESVYQEDGYSAISIGGYRETTKLLDVCLDGFQTAQLLLENQALRQIPVSNGDCDLVIGPRLSVATVLPVNVTMEDLVYRYADKPLTLPIQPGQHVSDLQIWNGSMCIAQAELYALNGVKEEEKKTVQTPNTRPGGSTLGVWILVVALVVIIVFLLIRYAGKLQGLYKRKRKRRYSRDRRRNR